MAVRNFWIETEVDGYKNPIGGGPKNKEGGFKTTITQRDKGSIERGIDIIGFADSEGNLVLTVRDKNGSLIHESRTVR